MLCHCVVCSRAHMIRHNRANHQEELLIADAAMQGTMLGALAPVPMWAVVSRWRKSQASPLMRTIRTVMFITCLSQAGGFIGSRYALSNLYMYQDSPIGAHMRTWYVLCCDARGLMINGCVFSSSSLCVSRSFLYSLRVAIDSMCKIQGPNHAYLSAYEQCKWRLPTEALTVRVLTQLGFGVPKAPPSVPPR